MPYSVFRAVLTFKSVSPAAPPPSPPPLYLLSPDSPAACILFQTFFTLPPSQNDPAFAAKYGFVFGEYRPQYFYWESIIM